MSHVRQAASSQDETRGSKEHDSSRTLFGFRFPAPLRNYSIIRFQKGLDSAPGSDSGQASPAFLVRIQQSFSSFRLTPNCQKGHASTVQKTWSAAFIRQYYAPAESVKWSCMRPLVSQLPAVVSFRSVTSATGGLC
jgi:hypothetical protein